MRMWQVAGRTDGHRKHGGNSLWKFNFADLRGQRLRSMWPEARNEFSWSVQKLRNFLRAGGGRQLICSFLIPLPTYGMWPVIPSFRSAWTVAVLCFYYELFHHLISPSQNQPRLWQCSQPTQSRTAYRFLSLHRGMFYCFLMNFIMKQP